MQASKQLFVVVALHCLVKSVRATTLKYPLITQSVLTLGPRKYHINETLIKYSKEQSTFCETQKNPVGPGIYVIEDSGNHCPEETKYESMSAAGMTAEIMLSPTYSPGCNIYMWSWHYPFKKFDYNGFVYIDAFGPDMEFLDKDNLYGTRVVLHSDGEPSDWQEMWEGGAWIFLVRIAPFFFSGALLAYAKPLVDDLRQSNNNGARLTVVYIELFAWVTMPIFFAIHGWHGSSTWLPYELIGFGQTYLAGSGFFTKIIMAFTLYETKQGMKEMRSVRPVLQTYKKSLIGWGIMFLIGLDFGMVVGLMTPIYIGDLIDLCIGCLLIGQLGVASFFFTQGFSVAKIVKKQVEQMSGGQKDKSAPMFQALSRMTKWLVISGAFMFEFVIVLALFALVNPYTPGFILFMFLAGGVGRGGGTFAQLISIKPPRNAQTGKRVTMMSKSEPSSTSATIAVTSAEAENSDDSDMKLSGGM